MDGEFIRIPLLVRIEIRLLFFDVPSSYYFLGIGFLRRPLLVASSTPQPTTPLSSTPSTYFFITQLLLPPTAPPVSPTNMCPIVTDDKVSD